MNYSLFNELPKEDWASWVEVDLKALAHNFKQLKRFAGVHTELLPVVKGDAYGHGLLRAAMLLDRLGTNFFGVSDIKEGIELRELGIKKPILLFESTLPQHAKHIVDYQLTPTICTLPLAQALDRYGRLVNRRIPIHIEIDTGMGRLGIWHEEAREFILHMSRFHNLSIEGLYTHFPAAENNRPFTHAQIHHLFRLIMELDKKGLVIPYIHAANSMGLIGYKTRILNLARPGLMLYGLYPNQSLEKKINLQPVLSVKARLMFIKKVKKGRSISYGRTFIAPRDMMVATLAVGYNDGYFRLFSNRTEVLVNGFRCPVIGRVTMDQLMIDVSRVKSAKVGQIAVVLGRQKKAEISADELAGIANTINYEIVCSLGSHLPRLYIEPAF